MTPSTAAARLSIALRPGARIDDSSRAFAALGVYGRFAAEVRAEFDADVLTDIVRTVELHAPITRSAA